MNKILYLLIALFASAGLFYHLSDTYTGAPFFYTCATGRSPPGLDFGWPVNGSLMLIDYYSVNRITNGGSQYIARSLWANIPKHNLTVIDPNLMVAEATDSTDYSQRFFLLINGTKWPFLGGGNQTDSFGISQDKVIRTTMSFLNTYPTTYYIPTTN